MNLPEYKERFIELLVRAKALKFGEFTTKSGRVSPYFLNIGQLDNGALLTAMGEFYAEALMLRFRGAFDALFGPAYKGIPLAVATGMALQQKHNVNVGVGFNRKEPKVHGEGGHLIGYHPKPGDRVVIVEDVTTAGTSIRETFSLFAKELKDAKPFALIVAVDRQERGLGFVSAQDELRQEYGIQSTAIVTLAEITMYLHNRVVDGEVHITDDVHARITAYRKQYGA